MPDCYSYISAPNVEDRSASTVIIGIHAEIILLRKVHLEWHDPVWPLFIGPTLVGPKRWNARLTLSVDCVSVVDPFCDRDIRRSGIRVLNIKEGHRGKFVIDRDRYRFGQISGFADYDQLLPSSNAVIDALGVLRRKGELLYDLSCGCHTLAGSKRAQACLSIVETRYHATAQHAIEFKSQ